MTAILTRENSVAKFDPTKKIVINFWLVGTYKTYKPKFRG